MNRDRVYELYNGDLSDPATQRCRDRIHWICAQAEGKRVLDVGCSQGITCLILGREGFECTGVDLEHAALDFAREARKNEDESVRRKIEFRVANALELPFPDGYFDTVVLGEVLEHLTQVGRALEEARRVLRDGGKVIVTVPFGLKPHPDHKQVYYPGSLLDAVEPYFRTTSIETVDHYLTYCGAKNAAAPVGVVADVADASRHRLRMLSRVEQRCLGKERSLHEMNSQLHREVRTLTEQVGALRGSVQERNEIIAAMTEELRELRAAPRGVDAGVTQSWRREMDAQRAELERALATREAELKSQMAEADRVAIARRAEVEEAHQAALATIRKALEDAVAGHEAAMTAREREIALRLALQEEEWRKKFDQRQEEDTKRRSGEDAAVAAELKLLGDRLKLLREQSERRQKAEAREHKSVREEERQLVAERIREVVASAIPEGSTVLVVSRGDEELLQLEGRRGLHFPQGPDGVYAGHHPANDAEAIAKLEAALELGADYLLIPSSAYWWLEHYPEFRRRLESRHPPVAFRDRGCLLFALTGQEGDGSRPGTARPQLGGEPSLPSQPLPAQQTSSTPLPHSAQEMTSAAARLPAGAMSLLSHASGNANGNGKSNGNGNGSGNGHGAAHGHGAPYRIGSVPDSGSGNPRGVTLISPPANGANGGTTVPSRVEPAESSGDLTGQKAPAPSPTRTPIAGILDEFTTDCLKPECHLITCRPDNWRQVLERETPRALFVESAWRGNGGSWQYRVAKYPNNVGDELNHMLAWASEREIPSIFWNKEDPVHFDRFIERARLFQYVFTTDANCVPAYRERLGHGRVFPLPFAAQPAIHNPILEAPRDGMVCFAGTYYGDRHAERRSDMDHILRPALEFGLDIYDRQHGLAGKQAELYRFPDIYQASIRGRLDYDQMVKAYKRYRVFLNVNSVKNSSTMFSRRVFELLASGTPVISTYSRGIAEMLGEDLVLFAETEAETRGHLERLLSDPEVWERTSLRGIRKVMLEHTYAERMRYVLERVGIDLPPSRLPRVAVMAAASTPAEIDSLLGVVEAQHYRDLDLLVIAEDPLAEEELERLRRVLNGGTVLRISPLERELLDACLDASAAEYFAFLDLRDGYGAHYLQDLALAGMYSGAALLGKNAYSRAAEREGAAPSLHAGIQYGRVASVPAATLAIRRDTLSHLLLRDCLAGRTIQRPAADILSIDRFNYEQRGGGPGDGQQSRPLAALVEV